MSYENPRIQLTDTTMEMLLKMSDGNPGALTVLMRTMREGPTIDPDSAFGEISAIISLDTYDIYGSDIWLLYKDVCGQDLVMMLGLLRATQLGFAPEYEIKRALEDSKSLTAERKNELCAKVKERLPMFGLPDQQKVQAA